MRRLVLILVVVTAGQLTSICQAEPLPEPQLRRPAGLAEVAPGRVMVAHRGGAVALVDVVGKKVLAERKVGRQLSDVAAVAGGRQVLATDQQAGELLLISVDALRVSARVSVSPTPVSVSVSADGARAYVASLWTRQLCVVELQPEPRITATVDLPFSPREQLLVRDGRVLLVADSFGGRLALLDTQTNKLTGFREIPATNIRGLAATADGRTLILSHQILSNLAETTHNDIHWGVLVTNLLRWLDLDRVLAGGEELLQGSRVHLLGDPGKAAGDPAGVTVTRDNKAIVALSGVGDVAIAAKEEFMVTRVAVGRRPVKLVLSHDERQVYVINQFSDSLSVVDVERTQPDFEISLGTGRKLTAAERGEVLFYDAGLSMEGWMSCHTCHTDGHSNHSLIDNRSDGSFGAAKRVLSLLGVAQTGPFAWNGQTASLEEQITRSTRSTMLGAPLSQQQTADLVSFVKTLQPPPSRDKLLGTADAQAIARGRAVFDRQQCADCHAPPTYTSPEVYDVGFKDQRGNTRFNPPSLRGVGQRAPLFHDNRAANLEEVLGRFQHQLREKLTRQQQQDLIQFLNSL